MSTLSIIFITVLICAEIDFLSLLFCREISDWLNAKSDEIRARAETLRRTIQPEIQSEPETPPETPPEQVSDPEIYKCEGSD